MSERDFLTSELAAAVRASGAHMTDSFARFVLEDFEQRGLVEPVLRSGWRATPLGLRLSRELARVGVAA